MPDDDVIVTIPNDMHVLEPGEDVQRQPTSTPSVPAAIPKGGGGGDEGVDELKSQLASMRGRVGALTQQVSQHARENADLRTRTAHSEQAAIETGLAEAEAAIAAAKQSYSTAYNAGDANAMADAQVTIGEATARRVQFQGAKAALESRPKETAPQARGRQPSGDPFEDYLASRTERTASWLREHPEYVNNTGKNNLAVAAHYKAMGNGIAADSDQYFEFLEKELGLRKVDNIERTRTTPTTRQNSVAPVSPTGSGPALSGAMEVRLSRAEAESATDGTLIWNYDDPSGKHRWKKGDPIGVNEMARRKAAMQKEGKYDRMFVDQ